MESKISHRILVRAAAAATAAAKSLQSCPTLCDPIERCTKYNGNFAVWFSCFQKNQWVKTAKELWGKEDSSSLFPTLACSPGVHTCCVPGHVQGTGNSISGTVSKAWAGRAEVCAGVEENFITDIVQPCQCMVKTQTDPLSWFDCLNSL